RSVIQIFDSNAVEQHNDDQGQTTMQVPLRKKLFGFLGLATSAIVASEGTAQEASQAPAFQIDEIMVASRRRDESLQQPPISVTARTGDQLEAMGVRNMIELGNFTPNVMTVGSGIGPSVGAYYLRGIGSGR